MEEPRLGGAYYTVASWTAAGIRPEQCIWRRDLVDLERLKKGLVFKDRQSALNFLKGKPKECTEES